MKHRDSVYYCFVEHACHRLVIVFVQRGCISGNSRFLLKLREFVF